MEDPLGFQMRWQKGHTLEVRVMLQEFKTTAREYRFYTRGKRKIKIGQPY